MRRALAALAAIVLLSGCGSSDDTKDANRYVDAVNAAQGRLTTALGRLSGEISSSTSPAADRRTLQAFDTAVGGAVATLRRIQPPSDVTPLHRRLVRELEDYDRELRRETAVLRSDDVEALLAAQRRLLAATNETSQQINDTLDEINARLRS
jgi:Tfp pilus assembly protein PilP